MSSEKCTKYYKSTKSFEFGSLRITKQEQLESRKYYRFRTPNISIILRDIFLPENCPESVSEDYEEYQVWDTLQDFAATLSLTLQKVAMLKLFGVGRVNATTYNATILLFLQDTLRKLSSMLFVWAKGNTLDEKNKEWRLAADFLFNLAIFLDIMCSQFLHNFSVIFLCVSASITGITSTISGATRVMLHEHQARDNNVSNVTAKDKSQLEFAQMLGGLIAHIFVSYFQDYNKLTWSLYALCTLLHIYSSYRAVQSLQYKSLNRTRLNLCLKQFLFDQSIPNIIKLNQDEVSSSILGEPENMNCHFDIELGASVTKYLTGRNTSKRLVNIMKKQAQNNFFVIIDESNRKVLIVLHENVQKCDILEAYVRTYLAGFHFFKPDNKLETLDPFQPAITESWQRFVSAIEISGFNMDHIHLNCGEWRAQWKGLE